MKKALLLTSFAILLTGCQSGKQEDVKKEDKKVEVEMVAQANSYDFGPAVDKLILTLPESVESSGLSAKTFEVSSKREALEFSFETEKPEEKVRDEKREVTDVYLSDETGEKVSGKEGKNLTIEMSVSPTNPISYPFNMSVETMMSEKVAIAFNVTQKEALKTKDGKELANITSSIKTDKEGAISYPESEKFSDMTTTKDNNKEASIQYTDYKPEKDDKKHPLIIWLHGIGEGGTDKDIALNGNKVGSFASKEHQEIFGGAYLLVPQAETFWLDNGSHSLSPEGLDALTGKSIYTENLKNVIDTYVSENPDIDSNRIYVGGCSNGGFMTVNMIANYPGFFAAGFPVCEPFPNDKLTKDQKQALADTPLWFVQAETDPLVPADIFVKPLVKELEGMKAKDVYLTNYDKVEDKTGQFFMEDGKTPYEYMGHLSWIDALNNDPSRKIDGKDITLFEWMSQQSK